MLYTTIDIDYDERILGGVQGLHSLLFLGSLHVSRWPAL